MHTKKIPKQLHLKSTKILAGSARISTFFVLAELSTVWLRLEMRLSLTVAAPAACRKGDLRGRGSPARQRGAERRPVGSAGASRWLRKGS